MQHATTTPTQVRRPWRSTVRTLFQATLGFCSMWGLVVQALGLDTRWQWVAASLAVTAGVARVMALPAVEAFLRAWLPWLAAEAGTPGDHLRAGGLMGPTDSMPTHLGEGEHVLRPAQPQGDAHRAPGA